MVLDTFKYTNDANIKCSFISSLSGAEFLIIAPKPDVSDLLYYIPFPVAAFSLQNQPQLLGLTLWFVLMTEQTAAMM